MSHWRNYPMGPALRSYLHIDDCDYTGDTAEKPSDHQSAQFQKYLINYMADHEPNNFSEYVDILEQVTTMGLSRAGICFFEGYAFENSHDDFRAMLAIGSAYMMEGEHEKAIEYLSRAQDIEPQEISPYVNISLIYYAIADDPQALIWAKAGLKVEPNHQKLWEIIASVYIEKDRQNAGINVESVARDHNSYAGFSLAAELLNSGDLLLKAQLLEEPFNLGVRDEEFLVEYTAALGLAQQFERIPSILWQLEKVEGKQPSWKLLAHGAQAYLAMEQKKEAEEIIAKLEKNPETPQSIVADLKQTYEQQFVT